MVNPVQTRYQWCLNPPQVARTFLGARNWTQTFFSQTFRALLGYPSKIPGYPAKKVWFPWFRGTYRTFWPPPLHVEEPHPTRKKLDPKIWVWVPFSSLNSSTTLRAMFKPLRLWKAAPMNLIPRGMAMAPSQNPSMNTTTPPRSSSMNTGLALTPQCTTSPP